MLQPVYFQESGTPKTGLSPTINIYRLSDSVNVINAAALTEVAEGFYVYDFSVYDPTEKYTYICDSVTLTGTERYAIGEIGSTFPDAIEGSLTMVEALRIILARLVGVASGGGSSQITFTGIDGATSRVVMNVDSKGNRSSVSLDGS